MKHRWRSGLVAVLIAVPCFGVTGVARAVEPLETVLATTADVLQLATYQVRTVLAKPDGSTVERTTPAVVGVPAAVDVHGGLLSPPDLAVSVTPLPDRLRLSITKLPTAPASLPVLVEAVFALPRSEARPDLGVAYGYDQRAGTAPAGFTTDLLFSIFDPPRDTFTLKVSATGAQAPLSVIGELFTRSGASRLDPKRGRLTVDPVPAAMTFTAELESREARGARGKGNAPEHTERDKATVKVTTSRAVHAVVTAEDHRGDFHRDLVADIADLPTETTVSYTDEMLERTDTRLRRHQLVDYTASSRIGKVEVDVDEFIGTQPQRGVHVTATNLPRHFTADVTTDDGPRGNIPEDTIFVESRLLNYAATEPIDSLNFTVNQFAAGALAQQLDARLTGIPTQFTLLTERRGRDDPETEKDERTLHLEFDTPGAALGSLEAGMGNGEPVAYLDNPARFFKDGEIPAGTVPGYAFKRDKGLAVRLTGLSEALVDTADPLTTHAVWTGGPFLVRDCDPVCPDPGTTPPEEFRAVTANVLDFPADATITFSPATQRVTYTGSAFIRELRAVIDANPPLLKNATHAELLARSVPTGLDLTIDAGKNHPTDGSRVPLATFDAHGSKVGLLEVLFASDPDDPERLPATADGVLVRDLAASGDTPARFLLFGRITGLRKASVFRENLLGTPGTLRIQSFTTSVALDAPLSIGDKQDLVVDVGRTVGGKQERLVIDVDDRPNTVNDLTLSRERVALPLLNPDVISLPRGQRLHYEANRSAGDLVACLRAATTLPDFDCRTLVDDPVAVATELGLTARVSPLPKTLDLCLASDKGDLGRGHEGKNQNGQGEVDPSDPEEFAPVLPPVRCFDLPSTIDEADLCADDEGPGDPALKLDCLDNPHDGQDGRRLLVKTTLQFAASEPVTVNLVNCNALTTEINGAPLPVPLCTDFVKVSNLNVQTLRARLDTPVKAGDSGYAFIDTDNQPVSGKVHVKPHFEKPGDTELQLNLPPRDNDDEEFSADDRFVPFEAQITGLDGSVDVFTSGTQGSCDGPSGTDVEVKTVVEVKVLDTGLFDVIAPGFELFDELC